MVGFGQINMTWWVRYWASTLIANSECLQIWPGLNGRFWPGLCAELLDTLITFDVTILLDDRVLEEFRRIAREKLKVDSVSLEQTDMFFQCYAVILPTAKTPAPDVPDPDDARMIAAVPTAHADWFVTGDKVLLDRGHAAGMPIIHPRQAYMQLRGLN
jgi:predicted nucleic acid-binding protein